MRPDEVRTDAALVRQLLLRQFPQWARLPIVAAEAFGTDNATYRLGQDKLVRLPRQPVKEPQVAKEQRWLPVLAPRLPLAVPVPLGLGRPAGDYPFQWSVYPWLAGENPTFDTMADRDGTARELAEFLAALHRIDPAGGPVPDASNSFRGVPMGDGRQSVARDADVRARIAALDGQVDTAALTAVWEAALAAGPAWDGRPRWIHGDLTPGNLLAVRGRLTGVIDFGCSAVGDPACDLAVAWTFLTGPSRAVFRAALGVDEATWARGRGWGLATTLPSPAVFDAAADPGRAARARRLIDDFIADHQQDR